jgi:hypothetical protein
MFMDTGCTCREHYVGEQQYYTFTGKCCITGATTSVDVKGEELYRLRKGEKIQNALTSNTDSEREFLMSGLSDAGWNILFPPDAIKE